MAQAGGSPSATQPEKQKPLNVDRDPVATPDGENGAPNQPPTAATIGRDNGKYTLQRNVDEVVLNATVLDDHQHMVTTLAKDDFKVSEDGVAQTITSFQHQDIPISLGILVDNSGSMRTKRQAVNSSALDLVHASNPDDESFVVNFSDEAYIDQDFTANVTKLRDGLSHIDSKGGTALYDAIMASADYLTKNAKRPKQVLLVITDGEDNASSTTLEETVRRIQDLQGPVVYCVPSEPWKCSPTRLGASPSSLKTFLRWMKSQERLRAIFASSTRLAITPPSRPSRAASARFVWRHGLKGMENSRFGPALAIIPTLKRRA
jgi:Ca-activated chloride channel family protein